MSDTHTPPQLVVGVGASAGGFEALKQLLSELPADSGMAFLLVQHLDPTNRSLLVELLAPCTDMVVRDADQAIALAANTVYIIRPDTSLAVRHGRIELSAPTSHRGGRPVDHLFRSLAREYGPRSAGIVLSGAGSDGSAGVRDIKAAGGLTIAQNPDSSGQSGMPQSAIDTGVIDLVLEIPEMPAALTRFLNLPLRARVDHAGDVADRRSERPSHLSEHDIGRLAAVLEAQTDFDLRIYKPATVERRVLRRMVLAGFDDVEPYLDKLRAEPNEQQTLVRNLLISVTEFFRDADAFAALRQIVVEPMVDQAGAGDTLRAWVPGCATGEEAYSIAMELLDAADTRKKRLNVQIFATDIDQDALANARAGIYPSSITDHVTRPRLQKYFRPLDGKGFQVRPVLRDVVSFAVHDLTKDPPFSRMHLVSCRNVLIYFTSDAQRHVLKVLHFALDSEGYLFLSTSESAGPQRELFSTISKAQRIYRKVGASRQISVTRSRNKPVLERLTGESVPPHESVPRRSPGTGDLARRAIIEAFAPPTLVVSQDGTVIFSHGELGPYVRFPQGEHPRLELGSILRPEIATRVRAALYKCRRGKRAVTALSSPDGSRARVRIEARPAPALGDDVVILSFQRADSEKTNATERQESPEHEAVIDQLEKELQATREDLRNTVEELEASNEELRSSNEESVSVNEELQSANEELEATTEELRSLNEELTTVNGQLREKVDQLEQAHDDLQNFFASAKIATIFLDDRLCIKRFTPAAEELLCLDIGDAGRFIGDIARELLQNELAPEAKAVLEHLNSRSHELRTKGGRWISRQVLPYRTETRRIEGVVVTFFDITDLKAATERLSLRERQQKVIARLGLQALRETDLQGFMDQVVRDVQQTLETDFCELLELQPGNASLLLRAGVGWKSGYVGSAQVGSGADSQAGYTLQSAGPVIVDDLAKEKRFTRPSLLREHEATSGLTCLILGGDHPYGVLGAHTRQHRSFTPEDANFLQAAATVVGSAISRHQTRTRLSLEAKVASILAESASLDAAYPRLLEAIADELSASIGEVWSPEPGQPTLSCTLLHVSPARRRRRVEKRLRQRTFRPEDGLVGRVYQEGTSQWVTNLSDSEQFERGEQAEDLGMVSGFALPIRANTTTFGVMTFFSAKRLIGGEVFLRSLDGLGRTIGDFAQRTAADARTRLSEARKAAVVNASPDGIVTIDSSGTIVEFNAAAQAMFGYSENEAIGQQMADLIIPERLREASRAGLARVVAGGDRRLIGRRVEWPAMRKDGSELLAELAVTEIGVGDSRLFTGVLRDITDRKQMEDALLEADRQKDEFLAMLGHELRNPLAAIRSATELLPLAGHDNPRLIQAYDILERQTAHMGTLLDGLLDISRIIRGMIQLDLAVVDLVGACQDAVADASTRLNGRSLQLNTDFPSEPIWVLADSVRLSQIIDNLLTNAIKYTPDQGKITVTLTREPKSAVLTVRDTGVGIEPDLLPHVFEVFRQSKQNLDRSQGGLGLGLALVNTLVKAHGGSVAAKSDGEHHGSEFIVRLPLTKKAPRKRKAGPGKTNERLDILLIEDGQDTAETLRALLEHYGHRVVIARDGQQGISAARDLQPDVVLCDLGLPGGASGFDVAQALRGDPKTAKTKLIALTGYGRPDDKQRCADAGFDAHITKPVDAATLNGIMLAL